MQPDSVELPDPGVAHTLIVRLRREPGSIHWRVQVIDVRSGAASGVALAAERGDDLPAVALAAAITQLLHAKFANEA